MNIFYTPKEIVAQTGVSIHTLRYYEQLGLLDPVQRAANGHRQYTDTDVKRLDFLKRLKATGMPLQEMQHYIRLFRQGTPTLKERRVMLESHRQKIVAQVQLLQDTLRVLDGKIQHYHHQEQEFNLSL
jgi:DNA-binding transcriptional MerR regulator